MDRDGEADADRGASEGDEPSPPSVQRAVITIGSQAEPEEDEDNAIRPLPDRLVSELTAYRTLALRNAVANNPQVAMTALLHKLCLDTFQHSASGACLEASVRHVFFSIQPADLKDSPSAKAVAERHEAWTADLPKDEAALWDWLAALDETSRATLLAHCVSFGVNALYEKGDRYGGAGVSVHVQRRLVQADRLAQAVGLDMVEAGWRPVDNYLGRVTKPRILEAVREAKGEQSAQLIDHLKKAEMAKEAERLLDGTGWLPEPLRLATTAAADDATERRRNRRSGSAARIPHRRGRWRRRSRASAAIVDDEERGGVGCPAHLSTHPLHARPWRRAHLFQETTVPESIDITPSTGSAPSDWGGNATREARITWWRREGGVRRGRGRPGRV